MTISLLRALLLCLAALSCWGCAIPGIPRFANKAPPALIPASAPLSPRQVVLLHQPLGPFTYVSSGPTFRLAVGAARRAPRGDHLPLSEVRSADERLSPPTYDRLRCGWQAPTYGLHNNTCSGRNRARDRQGTLPIVRSALASLQRQAATGGARVVAEVKCFATRRHLKGKLWCEGIAMSSRR